jgi:hypothetical protein
MSKFSPHYRYFFIKSQFSLTIVEIPTQIIQ